MKRKFFSGEFLRMSLKVILILFLIANLFITKKANAVICYGGYNTRFSYLVGCSSNKEINLNNQDSVQSISALKEEKDFRLSEGSEKAKKLKKKLDLVIEEDFKDSNDVLLAKNIIDKSSSFLGRHYDNLTAKALDYQRSFFLHDTLGLTISFIQDTYVHINFKELLEYLNKKSGSSDEELKKSVSPALKEFLKEIIDNINRESYKTSWLAEDSNNMINDISYIETEDNTRVTITLYSKMRGEDYGNGPIMAFEQLITSSNYPFTYEIPKLNLDPNKKIDDPKTLQEPTDLNAGGICDPRGGFLEMFKNPNCSLIAYLVNLTLKGLTSIFGVFLTLAGKLLDWAIGFSIYNFSDLVANSGAYEVWRKVILALVTSLLLPLVFYYIIRMLIDNDTDKIQKILPKIIFTALFVYFSFTVVGFLIDQANILSIYIYRSLHSPDQSIASSMESLIIGDPSLKDPDAPGKGYSLGDWSAVPVMAIQLLMVGVGIMILFQAAILIFVRGVILILCLIFSPIMLLPSGIHSKIDEYRKKIIEYFTNSTIMAPVFLFLVLIAIKVGEAGSSIIINTDSLSTLSGTSTISGKLIGAAISGVISVIILQLAISTAKQLSGDIGNRISGKISSFIGNTALGGTARLTRMGASKLVNNKKFNGWISKGGTRGRLALKLQKSANNSTFDVRNNKTFAKATGNTFGKGSNTTINSAFEKRYAKEKEFYNRLNPEAQEKHIRNLRRGWTGTSIISNGNRVADRLEGKNSELSFKEKMDTNKNFKNKFDKANKETDTDKRMEKIYESIDSHFKANGKGEKYFTKQMKKEKYTEEFKEKLEKINKDKSLNEEERKNKILDIVNKFEEKKKEERENAGENTKDKKEKKKEKKASTNPSQSNMQGVNTQANIPTPSIKDESAQQSLKSRLQAKYGDAEAAGLKLKLQRESSETNLKKEKILRKEENQRYTSDKYQEKILENLGEKNRSKSLSDNTKRIREDMDSISKNLKDIAVVSKEFTEGLKNLKGSLIDHAKNTANSNTTLEIPAIPIGNLGKEVKKLKEQNK